MPRIVHIALKVPDLEKATQFYSSVFGFKETKTSYDRGHVSRHMTDGNIDLALMVYDSEDVEEAETLRAGPVHPSLGHRSRRPRRHRGADRGRRRQDHLARGRQRLEIPRAGRHRRGDGVKAGRYKKKPESAGA